VIDLITVKNQHDVKRRHWAQHKALWNAASDLCSSYTVFELQQVICQKSPILTYPTCIWHTRWGDPVQISHRSSASENCHAVLFAWSYI